MCLSFYNRFNQKIDYRDQKNDEHSNLYRVFVALKQDLQNMLNTQPRINNAAEHDLSATILNYGLPSLKNFNLLSTKDQDAFCIALQQSIQWHEPRLTDVSIKLDVNENFPAPDLTVDFKIYATLILDNTTHPLELQSSLHTDGGDILIKNIKNSYYGQ